MDQSYEMKTSSRNVEVRVEQGHKHSLVDPDDQELIRLGKKPVLKRTFGFLSMLGFNCTVMITWEGVLLLLSINFTNGGYAGSVYGYLMVWLGIAASFSTMAELASMAPTAGGQYHWVSMLAPKRSRVFLSYIIGWLTMVGWQAVVASGGFLCAQLIQGLIVLGNPSYSPQPWQTMLIYWAAVVFAIFVNTVISSLLPKVEGMVLILHALGFFAILIPLVYFAPHGTAKDVFTTFINEGGWPTDGISFMIGIIGPVFSLLGADGPVHMSEEIVNPAVNVPRAMVFGIALNGTLGFGMLIAVLFCLGDIDTVFATATGYPFMAIFQQAVVSVNGALAMASLVVIMNIAATISFVATASRMTWSFARDRGPPGWKWLRQVEPRTTLPLWSIAMTFTVSILISLIVLGSSVAFNDFVSLTVNGLYSSYLIGNSLLLYRRIKGEIQPYSPSNDGSLTNTGSTSQLTWGPWRIPEPFGTIVNAFGCAYMFAVLLFSFWPIVNHPTPAEMNYSSLMVGVAVIFSVVYYFVRAKKVYTGPVVEIGPK